jgi:tRNA (cytidine/uridine-2'-O-)-methyltransferase
VVLVEPDIPQNAGNIARLCAATGTELHLVGPLGFQLTDARLKRAGLDYWDEVSLFRHVSMEAMHLYFSSIRMLYFSTKGERSYTAADYRPGDALVFGSESRGLPDPLLVANREAVYTIPMRRDAVRSLNVSNAVSIVVYEALRQAPAEWS